MAKGPITGMTAADFDRIEKKLPLRVYTARIGYQGEDALDISRKSATVGQFMAPTWFLLEPFLKKRGAGGLTTEDWVEYTAGYLGEMRTSYRTHRDQWDALLARGTATLLCYCVLPNQCHRTLCAKLILIKLGAIYLGERQGVLPL
jgi:glycine cleavage system aminomethyltransferase T